MVLVAFFSGLGLGPAHAMPVAPGGPEYAWLFDEGSGLSASDAVGGHVGALVGGASWDADSAFGGAGNFSVRFGGDGDVVDVSSLEHALEGLTAFSFSAWIRSDSFDQNRAFFSGQEPGNQDLFNARYDDQGWLSGNATQDLLKVGLTIDGSGYQYESGEALQTTDWQHIAMVWQSGAGLALYVDGVLDTPTASTFGTVTGALSDQPRFLLGDGAKANWRGRLDEVAVWEVAPGRRRSCLAGRQQSRRPAGDHSGPGAEHGVAARTGLHWARVHRASALALRRQRHATSRPMPIGVWSIPKAKIGITASKSSA